MFTPNESAPSRRRFIRLTAGGLSLIPLVNLLGCSEDTSQQAAPQQQPASAPAERAPAVPAEQPPAAMPAEQPAAAETAPAAALARLDESDASATALGYRHDAGEVDSAKFPRYQAGQLCSNCTLYQANTADADGWAACSIFPGKRVSANGWCNAYVPKA